MSVVLVHSPKGGAGSTTVAANLAAALARRGGEVTAIDLTGQDSLGLHLGVRPDHSRSLAAEDDQIVVIAGVRLISVGQRSFGERDPSAIVARWAMGDATVIVDIASADREALAALLPVASLRLCVLTAEPGTLAVLPQAFVRAIGRSTPETGFVLNRVDERLRLARDAVAFLRTSLGDALIASIRRDEAVNEALATLEPLTRHAPSSAALADLEALADRVRDRLKLPDKIRGAA